MEKMNEFDKIDELYNYNEDDGLTDEQIELQTKKALSIKFKRLEEWYNEALNFVEEDIAQKFFGENGFISRLITFVPNEGYLFDPETLETGIDTFLETVKASRYGDDEGATKTYLGFSDAMQRISYLGFIIDDFGIYHSIKDAVIADLDEIARIWNNPMVTKATERRKREIKKLAESEREEIESIKNSQLS